MLALVLKKISVDGGVDGELVEGMVDLGEFIVNVGRVESDEGWLEIPWFCGLANLK